MSARRTSSEITAPRRHGVLLLIAALAFNMAFGTWSQRAAAVADSLDVPPGAIAICAAEGGIRHIFPDGTELPAEQPDDGSQGCPCCFVCVTACGIAQATPAGLIILPLPGERAAIGLAWFAAGTGFRPGWAFSPRPPGQAPPLSI